MVRVSTPSPKSLTFYSPRPSNNISTPHRPVWEHLVRRHFATPIGPNNKIREVPDPPNNIPAGTSIVRENGGGVVEHTLRPSLISTLNILLISSINSTSTGDIDTFAKVPRPDVATCHRI